MSDLEEIAERNTKRAELCRQLQNAWPLKDMGDAYQQASPEQLERHYAQQAEMLRAMFWRPHWYGRTVPEDVQ